MPVHSQVHNSSQTSITDTRFLVSKRDLASAAPLSLHAQRLLGLAGLVAPYSSWRIVVVGNMCMHSPAAVASWGITRLDKSPTGPGLIVPCPIVLSQTPSHRVAFRLSTWHWANLVSSRRRNHQSVNYQRRSRGLWLDSTSARSSRHPESPFPHRPQGSNPCIIGGIITQYQVRIQVPPPKRLYYVDCRRRQTVAWDPTTDAPP